MHGDPRHSPGPIVTKPSTPSVRHSRRLRQYSQGVALGLKVRHDHGSQFMSDDYQKELDFLSIESSPAYVRQPEGNGVADRFIRNLKEQLLWVHYFASIEELRLALLEFKEKYNRQWILEKHRYRTLAGPGRLRS